MDYRGNKEDSDRMKLLSVKEICELLFCLAVAVAVFMVMVIIVIELKPHRQTNIYYAPLEVSHDR